MSFIVLIGLVSSICSIIGLFISDKFKSNRWFYVIFIFIMTFACGYAVHYNSELERIKNIQGKQMLFMNTIIHMVITKNIFKRL